MNVSRVFFAGLAALNLRYGFLGLIHHEPALEPRLTLASGLIAAFILVVAVLITRSGTAFIRRLGARWNWLFMALALSTVVTKGWASELLSAWLCLIYAWDSGRDGDGRKSRARATADRWKRRLLERFRSEAPTPIPVPS